jgi:small subunit ribosomal protein S21
MPDKFERRVSVLVEVKKKDNESFDSLLRRFNRKIQQSGVLIRARKTRFFEPPKSRNLQRAAARRRSQIKSEKEELKKMGKPIITKKYGRR